MKERLAFWKTTYYNNNEQGVNSCPQDIAPYTECAVGKHITPPHIILTLQFAAVLDGHEPIWGLLWPVPGAARRPHVIRALLDCMTYNDKTQTSRLHRSPKVKHDVVAGHALRDPPAAWKGPCCPAIVVRGRAKVHVNQL